MSGTTPPVFDAAFTVLMGHEGGYVNDPRDPGGETKYGISKRAYPNVDIPSLTLEDAKTIYFRDYWVPAGCDLCPPALAVVVFDAAVNNGVDRAVRLLQEGLGVTADGIIGNQTRGALTRLTDPSTALANTHGARIAFMAGLSTWPTYGKGWSRRLALLPYQAAQIAAQVGALEPAKEA